MQTMKLNLAEINKFSPPSLWDLGALSMLISTLLGVIQARVGSGRSVHFYARMASRLANELRTKTRENLNMRIKAWVLLCPKRIAWVRAIIGEAAIRRWRKNRVADYALSKYFGDWQRKWPHGFKCLDKNHSLTCEPAYKHTQRTYVWKPFALTKIINVERFLYGQARPDSEAAEMRAAYYKLWGVAITDTQTWSQPRGARTLNPVAFTPDELAGCAEAEDIIVKKQGAAIIYPPPKFKIEYEPDYEDEDESKPP